MADEDQVDQNQDEWKMKIIEGDKSRDVSMRNTSKGMGEGNKWEVSDPGRQQQQEQDPQAKQAEQAQLQADEQRRQAAIKERDFLREHPETARVVAKAKFDAAQMDKRYTDQQKRKIEQSHAREELVKNDPRFSDEEKANHSRMEAMLRLGIEPKDLFRQDPHPKGKGIGDHWSDDELGMVVTLDPNGKKRAIATFAKTPGGIADAAKKKLDEHQLTRQAKLQDDIAKFRAAHMYEDKFDRYGVKVGKQLNQHLDRDTKIWLGYRDEAKKESGGSTQPAQSSQAPQDGQQPQAMPQQGAQPPKTPTQKAQQPKSDMPVINSDDDDAYEQLEPGTQFTDENGRVWRKPEDTQ